MCMRDVAAGMEALEHKSVAHGDLKPANVCRGGGGGASVVVVVRVWLCCQGGGVLLTWCCCVCNACVCIACVLCTIPSHALRRYWCRLPSTTPGVGYAR